MTALSVTIQPDGKGGALLTIGHVTLHLHEWQSVKNPPLVRAKWTPPESDVSDEWLEAYIDRLVARARA